MVIYVDLVFLINFIFDFILLLTLNIALKRYAKMYRLVFSALFGSITLISLFIKISSIGLFILKVFMAIIMCLIAFGYKNIKYTFYNVLYLFMESIILGGFLYYLNIEFAYNHEGLMFYNNGLKINYLFLIILAPLSLFVFIKSLKALREIKNYYYKVEIVLSNNDHIFLTAFLDTGNKLVDPITNKPIIIINRKKIKSDLNIRSPMYVPFNSLNNHGLLECIKPKYIIINKHKLTNYLIGLSDSSFKLNGVDCLLNYQVWEDIND